MRDEASASRIKPSRGGAGDQSRDSVLPDDARDVWLDEWIGKIGPPFQSSYRIDKRSPNPFR